MYRHVQESPFHWLLHLLAAFLFFVVWQTQKDPAPTIVAAVAAFAVLFFALSIRTLTISDQGEYLDVRYGPLNLLGTKIAYRDITAVEPGKTSVIDGWGIHFIPFRGWTFNLWGFECVRISLGAKVIRIGTDDSANLAAFLRERMTETTPTT